MSSVIVKFAFIYDPFGVPKQGGVMRTRYADWLTLVRISVHKVIATRVKVVLLRCWVFSNGVEQITSWPQALEHELDSVP